MSLKVQEFVAHSTQVNCLAFGPKSNQVLATGGEDFKVNIWRVENVSNVMTLGQNKSPIESLCFDSEEQYVVSGAMNGSLKVFDLNEDGKLARSLSGHQVNTCSVQYHPYGDFIVSGSIDGSMKVWDVRNRSCIQTYTGHSKEVTCVRFSPDGKWVASSSKDGQLLLWDLVAGKLVQSLKTASPSYVTSFEFNPADFALAAITSARTVRLWDLDSMEPIGYTPSDSNQVRAIAFSSLGSVMCSAVKDSLKIWDLDPSIKLKDSLEMGWDKISDMKISNNSQLVAGSCMSNFVSIYEIDLENYLNSSTAEEAGAYVPSVDKKDDNSVQTVGTTGKANKPSGTAVSKSRQTSSSANLPHAEAQSKMTSASAKESSQQQALRMPAEAMSPVNVKRSSSLTNIRSDALEAEDVNNAIAQSPPEVIWDSASSASDMATSMGESFWKRFKESQKQIAMERNRQQAQGPSEAEQDDQDKPGIAERPSTSGLEDLRSLEDFLPPSSFDNQSNKRPTRSSPASAAAPPPPVIPVAGARKPAVPAFSRRESKSSDSTNANNGVYRTVENNLLSEDPLQVVGMRHGRLESADDHSVLPSQQIRASAVSRQQPREHRGAAPASSSSSSAGDGQSEYKRCEEGLNLMLAKSASLSSLLSQRLASLRILKQLWIRGEMLDAIDHLMIHSDSLQHNPQYLVMLADFFAAAELKGSGLSLDCCVKILPILDEMVSAPEGYSSEHVIFAVFKALGSLAESFGDLIRNTRSVIVAGGVDLSREARLIKCNNCYNVFVKLQGRVDSVRHQYRKNPRVLSVVEGFQKQMDEYF